MATLGQFGSHWLKFSDSKNVNCWEFLKFQESWPTFMLEIFLFLIQFSVSHFSLFPQKIQLGFCILRKSKYAKKQHVYLWPILFYIFSLSVQRSHFCRLILPGKIILKYQIWIHLEYILPNSVLRKCVE